MPKLFECARCGATFERMLIDTPELCFKCARPQEVEKRLERPSVANGFPGEATKNHIVLARLKPAGGS
jgi:hypothetical protein